jgi:hypothetical protein
VKTEFKPGDSVNYTSATGEIRNGIWLRSDGSFCVVRVGEHEVHVRANLLAPGIGDSPIDPKKRHDPAEEEVQLSKEAKQMLFGCAVAVGALSLLAWLIWLFVL